MQDNKQPANASANSLKTDIVNDIPIAAPTAVHQPPDEDEDLDKIMRDVSKDVKEVGKKPAKRHWFAHDKKPKTDAKFSARPIDQVKPAPAAPASKPATMPQPVQTAPTNAKAVTKKFPKPPKTRTAPIGVILLAIVMTGALSAAAYYAYK